MDDRPHILYLIDVLCGRGGAEGALLRTTQLLPKDRYRCTVGTFRLQPGLPMLKEFPCPVCEFRLERAVGITALRMAFKLRKFIRSERVEIVHTFFQTSDLWGGLVAKLSGCRVLVSSRRDMGILRSAKHRLAYRILRPLFDQVQAVSCAVRLQTIRDDGVASERVVMIPNGIENDQIAAANGSAALREKLQLDGVSPLILTVGHLRAVKGIDVLLHTAARVCFKYPKAMFLIAGSVHDPGYYGELKELVRGLGLTGNVRFLGLTDQVWSLLKLCDVFCLLSRSEGMSNALLEAMASGLPCVASAVGGTPEMIEDGRSGYLVPSEDPDAAADRILRLLDDPEGARKMGAEGRCVVEERYSAQRMIDRIVASYDQLLEVRRTA